MNDKKTDPISPKTGVAKKVGDDAQKNASERVREGVPARAQPIIERQEEDDGDIDRSD